jgi:hypothetical protein
MMGVSPSFAIRRSYLSFVTVVPLAYLIPFLVGSSPALPLLAYIFTVYYRSFSL